MKRFIFSLFAGLIFSAIVFSEAYADPTFSIESFTGLRDAPSSYLGESGNCVAVNGTETGLEFVTCGSGGGGTPAGSNTEVQYNASGVFGAESGFTYNPAGNILTTGSVIADVGGGVGTYYTLKNTATAFLGNVSDIIFSNNKVNGSGYATMGKISHEISDDGLDSDGSDLVFYTYSFPSLTERMRLDSFGDVGIGTVGLNIEARTHIVSTTEQLRLGYNAANYISQTVNSSGTFSMSGGSANRFFEFSGNATYRIGDIDALVNGGNLTIEDGTSTATFSLLDVVVGSVTPLGRLHVASSAATFGQAYFSQHDASADSFDLNLAKSRGTGTSPTVITTADELGVINFSGYGGASGYVIGAAIKAISSGTIADTRIPAQLEFWTGTNATPTVLTRRFYIDSSGIGTFVSSFGIGGNLSLGNSSGGTIQSSLAAATAGSAITISGVFIPKTNTSGQTNWLNVAPSYNQASGTAANTDLLINRTQTAVGSGAQYLIDAQVGGTSKFRVSNSGAIRISVTGGITGNFINTTGGVNEGAGMAGYTDDGAATTGGDRLGFLVFGGASDASSTLVNSVLIGGYAAETWSGSAQGGYITFETTPIGSTTASRTVRMTLTAAGRLGLGTTAPDKIAEFNLGTADAFRLTYNDGNGSAATYMDATISSTGLVTFTSAGSAKGYVFSDPVRLKGYTVATLPTGVTGDVAYVTDQLTAVAAKGVAPTGGGSVVCVVYFDGAGWKGI